MDAKQGSSSKRKNKAEKLSPEEKKRRAALARWKKKLGPIGGAGPGFKLDGKRNGIVIYKDFERFCRSF